MKRLLIIIAAILLTACTGENTADRESPATQRNPLVVTSNYPLYFFTTEIAGDHVEVRFPTIEGDPAMWVPGNDEMGILQDADLLILNGAGYESWLDFITLPSGQILDTTAQVQSMLLPVENTTVHQHGPQGEHSHEGTAFTTWLDPKLAIEQARAITHGLTQLRPELAESFAINSGKLEDRLNQLDRSLARAFAALGDQPVVFSHPVYQYLQQRYGIKGRNVHWEPDVEPGTREWIGFGNLMREHPAKIMIWEAPPLQTTIEKLTQMGIDSLVFRPIANTPLKGDYFTTMEQNLLRLKEFTNRQPDDS
jgi:zinc transport system substrate-binding protein